MQRPRNFISDTERVLFVLDSGSWVCQTDIIKWSRMAPAHCIVALKQLTKAGEIEWSKLKRGAGQGSGRPAFIYRKRRTGERAA